MIPTSDVWPWIDQAQSYWDSSRSTTVSPKTSRRWTTTWYSKDSSATKRSITLLVQRRQEYTWESCNTSSERSSKVNAWSLGFTRPNHCWRVIMSSLLEKGNARVKILTTSNNMLFGEQTQYLISVLSQARFHTDERVFNKLYHSKCIFIVCVWQFKMGFSTSCVRLRCDLNHAP